MLPYIGCNYFNKNSSKVMLIDFCLEWDKNSFQCVKDRSIYYSLQSKNNYNGNLFPSVENQALSEDKILNLNNLLPCFKGHLPQDDILYHTFITRPLKKFDNPADKFTDIPKSNDDGDIIEGLLKYLDDKDLLEAAKIFIELLNISQPNALIIMGSALQTVMEASMRKFIESYHDFKNSRKSGYFISKVIDTQLETIRNKNAIIPKLRKSILADYLDLVNIAWMPLIVDKFFELDNDGELIFRDNTTIELDSKAILFLDSIKIHPCYPNFLQQIGRLQYFYKNVEYYYDQQQYDKVIDKLQTIVKQMLNQKGMDRGDRRRFTSAQNGHKSNT